MDKLLVICGPTSTGKTALALQLAKELDGELVSADSRQIYRGMDIGTGKDLIRKLRVNGLSLNAKYNNHSYVLFAYDMRGVPIWMYDVVSPDEEFSVAHYQYLARVAISNIWSRGKMPIIVGGTGFYISSLISAPTTIGVPPDKQLRGVLNTHTVHQLQGELNKIAPSIYASLNNSDKHNPRRLVRKIEIALQQAKFPVEDGAVTSIDVKQIGLVAQTSALCERIKRRVTARMNEGIIGEIGHLLSFGYSWDLPSMSSLGYIQWKPYFEEPERLRKEELKESIVKNWKHDECAYAKRQVTWFKKQKNIMWFDITDLDYSSDVTKSVLAWYTKKDHEHKT